MNEKDILLLNNFLNSIVESQDVSDSIKKLNEKLNIIVSQIQLSNRFNDDMDSLRKKLEDFE